MRTSRPRTGFRIGVFLAAAAVALVAGGVAAQPVASGGSSAFQDAAQIGNPIFEQYAACTGGGPASQQFPDFGDAVLQAADDFNSTGEQYLEQFVAYGSFSLAGPIETVTFQVFDNDGPGGLPGTLRCSETGIPNNGDGPVIDLALDGTCELVTDTYWVSVTPVMSFADFGQWFWSSNETGFGSEFAFQDPDGLVGNPCVTWGLGITDCGVGSNYPNLCFGVGAVPGCGGGG